MDEWMDMHGMPTAIDHSLIAQWQLLSSVSHHRSPLPKTSNAVSDDRINYIRLYQMVGTLEKHFSNVAASTTTTARDSNKCETEIIWFMSL